MSKTLLQIKPYALIEYDYDVVSISTTSTSFIIIDSAYTNERQVLNTTGGNNPTFNILDRTATRLNNSNTFAHLDQDRAVPYDVLDSSNLVKSYLSNLTNTQWPVNYQTIKLHLLSGYNLEDLDGLLLTVKFPENSGKNTTVGQLAYLKGDDFIKFNARPIVISGRSYDRYIELKIPSLYDLNSEFYANPTSGELGYWLSSDGMGFIKDGLISIQLSEILTALDDGTSLILTTGEVSEITVKESDAFSQLTAVIEENEEEDTFEYYPSWQGGFVEDLITNLNGIGGDYYVFHELYIYEQVGFSQIQTDYFVSIQDDSYNAPKRFRPVLKNADNAYSFSIDYVMRLTDRGTGSQIIRTASITSFDPKRFGRNLDRIVLEGSVRNYNIYNKIVEENKLQISRKVVDRKIEKVSTPVFFDFNEVAVNTSNVILKTDGTFTAESVWNWDIIFGQGEAILLLHPYENYVKFKLHRYLQGNETQAMDLRYDVDLFLVIEYSDKRVKFAKLDSFFSTNLAEGEVIFKIPQKEASAIYANKSGTFYLTSKVPSFIRVKIKDSFIGEISGKEFNIISKEYYSKGDTDNIEVMYNNVKYFVQKSMMQQIQVIPSGSGVSETTIYTGKWRRMDDADTVKDDIEKIRRAEIEKILSKIQSAKASLDVQSNELTRKGADLAALEAKLNAQSAANAAKDTLLSSLQSDITNKEKILSQREQDIRDASRTAAENENANIAAFQDQINKVLDAIKNNAQSTGTGVTADTSGDSTTTKTTPSDGSSSGSGSSSTGTSGSSTTGGSSSTGSSNTGSGQSNTSSGNKLKPGLPIDINLVDYPGRAGNDMAVLPSMALKPLDMSGSTNGNSNNNGNTSNKKINLSNPLSNILNSSILSSTSSTSKLSLIGTSISVSNGAESNSGSNPSPPSGNTDKVVLGTIKDWVLNEEDEFYFLNETSRIINNPGGGSTGEVEAIKYFKITIATTGKKQALLEVDTTQFLSVGDILTTDDGDASIQVTAIYSPNKIDAMWTNPNKKRYLPYLAYSGKIRWNIQRPVAQTTVVSGNSSINSNVVNGNGSGNTFILRNGL